MVHTPSRNITATGWLTRAAMLALFAVSLFSSLPAPRAQEVQGIAAIVNDRVISRYDIQQRMRFLMVTAGLEDTRSNRQRLSRRAFRILVDESLQIGAAEKRQLAVTEEDLKRAHRIVEGQAGVAVGELPEFLRRHRLDPVSFDEKLRSEILWNKLIGSTMRAKVVVSEDEIEEILDRLKQSQGKPEYRLSEIILAVNSLEQALVARRRADRLRAEIEAGARFAGLARQFSTGPTARQGGAVGWIRSGQLDPILERVLEKMAMGAVSAPVEVGSQIYLLLLHEKRQGLGGNPLQNKVELRQVMLPIEKAAGKTKVERIAQAVKLRDGDKGCDKLDGTTGRLGLPASSDLGEIRLGELPANIRSALQGVAVGGYSKAIITNDRVMVLMVCARQDIVTKMPSRDRIRRRLKQQKVNRLAEKFLRDLRRDAVIDIR